MDKTSFLEILRQNKKAYVKCYKSGEDPNVPFLLMDLHIMAHNASVALITPAAGVWAEYSPKYDIESFDGTTMVFVAEEYIMEVRL